MPRLTFLPGSLSGWPNVQTVVGSLVAVWHWSLASRPAVGDRLPRGPVLTLAAVLGVALTGPDEQLVYTHVEHGRIEVLGPVC